MYASWNRFTTLYMRLAATVEQLIGREDVGEMRFIIICKKQYI